MNVTLMIVALLIAPIENTFGVFGIWVFGICWAVAWDFGIMQKLIAGPKGLENNETKT